MMYVKLFLTIFDTVPCHKLSQMLDPQTSEPKNYQEANAGKTTFK